MRLYHNKIFRTNPAARMKKRNLHKDAEEIFRSAVAAVDPEHLVRQSMRLRGTKLTIGSRAYNLNAFVDKIGTATILY